MKTPGIVTSGTTIRAEPWEGWSRPVGFLSNGSQKTDIGQVSNQLQSALLVEAVSQLSGAERRTVGHGANRECDRRRHLISDPLEFKEFRIAILNKAVALGRSGGQQGVRCYDHDIGSKWCWTGCMRDADPARERFDEPIDVSGSA